MANRIARPPWGLWLLALAAVAGTALAVYSYYLDLGVNHTDGVLLVVGTTLIMWVVTLVLISAVAMWRWLRGIILLLLLIDIVGTAAAAWFLEIWILIAFMAVALVGWLAHVGFGPGRLPRVQARIVS